MTTPESMITIDRVPVPFKPGQTIFEAALAAGVYIPHLCAHPDFAPHGSCKLCTVLVNGRNASACALKTAPGQEVEVDTPELQAYRRTLVQMLFVEGNHFCPGCEKSGNCQLQALGYEFEMMTPHFVEFFPSRDVDASHPDALIDFNRCILCELCVRASRDVDHKRVFALAGRGLASHPAVMPAADFGAPFRSNIIIQTDDGGILRLQSEPLVESAVGKHQASLHIVYDNGVAYVFHEPPIAGLAFPQCLLRLQPGGRQLLLSPVSPSLLPHVIEERKCRQSTNQRRRGR